jgi:hypothetical protein
MKKLLFSSLLSAFAALLLCATFGYAMPIASSARSMVPSEVQQLIGVDYRGAEGFADRDGAQSASPPG